MSGGLLSQLIALPLLAALLIVLLPQRHVAAARRLAFMVLALEMVWSLQLLGADYSSPGYRFVERAALGGSLRFAVGVDGLSLWLLLSTIWLCPVLAFAAPGASRRQLAGVLWLEGSVLGCLCAFDLLLFFAFFELALLPGLMLGEARSDGQGAALPVASAVRARFAFEWIAGLLLLLGIVLLAGEYAAETGRTSYDLLELGQLLLPVEVQRWYFLLLAVPFAVRLQWVPLHGLGAALSGAGASLSGLGQLLASTQLGLYGLMRVAMGLLPAGSHRAGVTIAAVGVVGMFYAALAGRGQPGARARIAYAALACNGVLLLGLFSISAMGVMGALLLMLVMCASLSLAWVALDGDGTGGGGPEAQTGGGTAREWPERLPTLALLALVGLPLLGGFPAHLMIFGGALRAEHLGANATPLTCLALIAGALTAANLPFAASATSAPTADASDRSRARIPWVLAIPALALVLTGLYPAPLLERMEPAADHFARVYTAKLKASDAHPATRGLLERAPLEDPAQPTPGGEP